MRTPNANRKVHGFTFIEIIVTAVVLAILAGVGYATVVETNKALGKKNSEPAPGASHTVSAPTAQIKVVENVKPFWHPSQIC